MLTSFTIWTAGNCTTSPFQVCVATMKKLQNTHQMPNEPGYYAKVCMDDLSQSRDKLIFFVGEL